MLTVAVGALLTNGLIQSRQTTIVINEKRHRPSLSPLQGDPSGCWLSFVDTKAKVAFQYRDEIYSLYVVW